MVGVILILSKRKMVIIKMIDLSEVNLSKQLQALGFQVVDTVEGFKTIGNINFDSPIFVEYVNKEHGYWVEDGETFYTFEDFEGTEEVFDFLLQILKRKNLTKFIPALTIKV